MDLPSRPVAWYGDDFTGSTDVLEVLTLAGVPSVLFLRMPTPQLMARFPEARGIGLAGDSRSHSSEWMKSHLPQAFAALRAVGARWVHYKVCSTFDSSPDIGSVGAALDLGRAVLSPNAAVPIVIGAPALRRYCAFGNLFARVGEETFRLDRHPTMSRHPVTPMREADLRRHLAAQTEARVELVDLLSLAADDYRERFARVLRSRPDAILFDVIDALSLCRCGELIWEAMPEASFAVGSSGLEYAFAEYWKSQGEALATAPLRAPEVDRMAVVSGSCSPDTAQQIQFAERAGWESIPADPSQLVDPASRAAECERLESKALTALARGASVVVHTACGPSDPRVVQHRDWLRGADPAERDSANEAIGGALGQLLLALVKRADLERVTVAGGDTSSAAGPALGIDALTMIAPIAPGSPLCRAHGTGGVDGLSVVFKGGQVGVDDFFEAVRHGRSGSGNNQSHFQRRASCLQ